MNFRLIWAIVSNILEEAAIAVVVLLGLPRIGIKIPLWGLIALMLAWLAFSTFTYFKGNNALMRKPLAGLSDMAGSRGKVVVTPAPYGVVRIKGELWDARSIEGEIDVGQEVEVVKQEGLKLLVRRFEHKKS